MFPVISVTVEYFRGDCMRLLGQLGALSPYKNNKVNLNELRKFPITQPVPMEAACCNKLVLLLFVREEARCAILRHAGGYVLAEFVHHEIEHHQGGA